MIYSVLDRENLPVAATVVALTATKITSKVIYARIQVQVASLRVTYDGTDPNPATPIGELLTPGDIIEIWGSNLSLFKAVRYGSTSGKIEVHYLGSGV